MIPTDQALIERAYAENRAQIDISIQNKIAKYKAASVRAKFKGQHEVAQTFRDLAASLETLVGV